MQRYTDKVDLAVPKIQAVLEQGKLTFREAVEALSKVLQGFDCQLRLYDMIKHHPELLKLDAPRPDIEHVLLYASGPDCDDMRAIGAICGHILSNVESPLNVELESSNAPFKFITGRIFQETNRQGAIPFDTGTKILSNRDRPGSAIPYNDNEWCKEL